MRALSRITSGPIKKDEDSFYSNLDAEASKVIEQDPYIKLDLEAAQTGFDITPTEEKPSYAKQAIGAIAKGGMQVGKAILNLPKQTAWLIANFMEIGAADPAFTTEEEILKQSIVGKPYEKLMKEHERGVKRILETHPEWEREPSEGFLDLATDPRKLSLAVVEALPLLAGAGVLTAGGRPDLSISMMTATEGQGEKDRILQEGGTEEQANIAYWAYGIPAGAIEHYLHIKPALKLGKMAYQRVLTKSAKEVSKRGIKGASKYLVPIIQETIEEPLQGAWEDWVTTSILDKSVFEGGIGAYVDRRAQEALIAGVTALIPGVGGEVVGRGKRLTMSRRLQKAGIPKGFSNTIADKIVTEGKNPATALQETFEPPIAGGTYTGDIITEKKRIIDLVKTPIADQASLEEYGNEVAKHLEVEGDIEWVWSNRPVKRRMGLQTTLDKENKKYRVTIYGKHELHHSQTELKDTIVEELTHIATPPKSVKPKNIKVKKHPSKEGLYAVVYRNEIRNINADSLQQAREKAGELFAHKSIHHAEFKQWMKNALEATIYIPVEKPPVTEPAIPAESKPETSPAEKKRKPYQSQYVAGHEIPKLLGMKEGERRKLMKKEAGVTSMKKMTPSTAQDYIDALHKLAREKGIETGMFPSERKFKKPIIGLTPQLYKAKILGVEFMIKPAVIGKQELDIEFAEQAKQVDEMEKIINKLGGETRRSRAAAKLKGKPTKSIERFAELLNEHEEAPDNLSEEEKKIFNYFRNLNRAILVRENAVREELDMEPIAYKTGYIRHIVDTLVQDVMEGRHPIPEELKYWAEEHASKKIRNPMEFQRKLGDELEEIFSKDLIKATKAMLWTGLREIHLDKPLKHFENQIGLHSEVIPDSTRRWAEKFINHMIVGKQTAVDKRLDEMVKEGGIGKIINKILRPFGKNIGHRPLTKLMSKAGRLQIYGVMGWRPKQLIRNKFQVFQNLALYTVKSNLKSYLPADKQLKDLLSESLFLKTYKGFEDLKEVDKHTLGKWWLAPFQWTAVSNAKRAMKTAYYDTLELITDPKYAKYGWASSKRTYTEEKGFLYPDEKARLLEEMEFGAGVTQYHYIPMAMPGVFNYKATIPLTRLQSWWMNYFFKFHRESAHRFFKGETREGLKLPWSRRIGWGRYLVIGGLILNTLGYTSSYMFGAAPEATPPMFQLLYNLYKYIIVDNKEARASAKRKFLNALRTFIPGYLAYKDIKALLETDNWTELIFYKKGIFGEEPTSTTGRRRKKRVRPRRVGARR